MKEHWIESWDQHPASGQLVLMHFEADYGRNMTSVGMYVGKHSIQQPEDADFNDYDEKTDTFYMPEGWYEKSYQGDDTGFWFIRGEVTHWMPILRPVPKEQRGHKIANNI